MKTKTFVCDFSTCQHNVRQLPRINHSFLLAFFSVNQQIADYVEKAMPILLFILSLTLHAILRNDDKDFSCIKKVI